MLKLHRLFSSALTKPFADSFGSFEPQAAPARDQIVITAVKAMQVRHSTLVKVETDAGIAGYGPCGGSGPYARAVIERLNGGRLPHLGLIGKDPLAIQVHHHNMFYAYPQRGRQVGVLSGIDIALWDLAGKILGQPVSRLLGGNFRDEIETYSHCGNYLDAAKWRDQAQELKEDPRGFRAFKVDIHHPLGGHMQQYIPSIGPREARKVRRAYELAREAFGDEIDIIVHCHNELDVPSAIKVAEAVEPIQPLFFEDPLAPAYCESWMALRRATRLPIMTGENIELAENALPFLQNQAVSCLQPDLVNSGGITGVKAIADLAGLYRIPVCLHNVSGYALHMASLQWSAAVANCPLMECRRNADRAEEAASGVPEIREGHIVVPARPGMGYDFDMDFLKGNLAEGEPWWG
jgi:L-alanine-DL-glutamate epimerase-like enolase superfamily enzyme